MSKKQRTIGLLVFFLSIINGLLIDLYAQNILRGTVQDNQGSPLPGVHILEKGTSNRTISNAEGHFSLNAQPNATILFKFIGFEDKEIKWDGKSLLTVTMLENSELLEQVVVVGYGTQKQETLTGAISRVDGKELESIPNANFSNALVGKVPGLVVLTRSGEPGSDGSTLRIRGMNTLGDNSPLVVVDGISNRDLQRLDPNDIESITVLKDASAAIYGSKAANGVILVTTKRGKKGKPQVRITYNEGAASPTVLPKVLDAATYLEVLNEVGNYAGQDDKYSAAEIENYRNQTDPWKYPNTDWYGETLKKFTPQRNVNLSISGGQDYLSYFISLGGNFQEGIYKNSANKYRQFNLRVNLDGKINDNISYGVNYASLFQNRTYPVRSASTIFSMLRRGYPYVPAYWPNGAVGPDLDGGNNPVTITTNRGGYDLNRRNNQQISGKLKIRVPWIEGLTLTGNVAFDTQYDNDKLWQKPWYTYTWDRKTYDENNNPALVESKKGFTEPQLRHDFREVKSLTLNGLMDYETTIAESHNLKVLLGIESISGNNMSFWAFRKGFVSSALEELFAGGDAEKDNNGSSGLEKRMNFFGRVNYDYQNKYLLEFLWRYDGSYIFPEDKRFGFFPGVSIGWRISEEPFWEGIKSTIDYLKLRASWGQTGNDRISAYQYLASYGYLSATSDVYVFNGDKETKMLTELRVPNPNVTWEVANQTDLGLEAKFFDSRLALSFDYFYNLRTNILWNRNASVPSSTGLTLPRENIGEVINQGFEAVLSYGDQLGSGLSYNASLNLNFNNNKIKFWDETPGAPEYQKSTGHPMNAGLYYKAIGVFKDQAALDNYPHWKGARPGDVIFEDVNNDNVIDGLDRVRIDKTDVPTHVGGLNLGLDYKGLYTNLFFQWATGAMRYDYYQFQGESGNYLVREVEGRWTEKNPSSTKARAWNRYFEYWRSQQNTYWMQNSDYLRLKSLEIGYNLPKNWVQKCAMENARIYFTGSNLLTFTGIKDFDPESTSHYSYPLNKIYNLGVSITF